MSRMVDLLSLLSLVCFVSFFLTWNNIKIPTSVRPTIQSRDHISKDFKNLFSWR